MKLFLKKIFFLFSFSTILFALSNQTFAMGAKKPQTSIPVALSSKPVLNTVVSNAGNLLPLFWNVKGTDAAATPLGRVLPLIENLLPLFSSISPLAGRIIPVLSTVAGIASATEQSKIPMEIPSQIISSAGPVGGPYMDQIMEMAEVSSCASHIWKNGKAAPSGFIKGMALSFGRSLCRQIKNEFAPSALVNILTNAISSRNTLDGLFNYKNLFSSLGLSLNQRGSDPLQATYLLGLGAGMIENGGAFCAGWNQHYSSAGAAVKNVMAKLFSEYKSGDQGRCLTAIFQEGTTCGPNNSSTFDKSCPAYGVEFAMAMLRTKSIDFKSINKLQAEVVPSCDELLGEIKSMIEEDSENACADIF